MTEETETKNKPPAPKPAAPKKKASVGGFGDAPLGGALVEPVSFDKRERTGAQHAADVLGLVLSPAQLALAMTVLPLASGTKPGLVAMLGGLVFGALVSITVQVPLLRYGIPLGVLARIAFGTLGARLFSAARLLVIMSFLGGALFLAAQTLLWCVLCSAPSLVGAVQRVPLMGGVYLLVPALMLLVLPVWMFAREPSPRMRVILLLPAVTMTVLLFVLPDNLPMGTAWGMLDVGDRTSNADVFPIFLLSFAWSASVFLTAASDARSLPTQIGQTMAVAGAGVLPWLLGSMAMALAVLSSGQNQGGFFDVPALACRRLGSGLLVPVLGTAVIAYVWPLVRVVKRAAEVSVQEMLGARPGAAMQKLVAYAFLFAGLGIAVAMRTLFLGALYVTVAAQLVVVCACLVIATQYFVVERARLVLDDLYTVQGAYRGVLGILPAGFASLAIGGAAYVWTGRMAVSMALSVGVGLAAAVLGQAVFGNVQRLITRRKR